MKVKPDYLGFRLPPVFIHIYEYCSGEKKSEGFDRGNSKFASRVVGNTVVEDVVT